MKQKYYLLALAGLLMSSCNNESATDTFGPVFKPSSGQMTFVFPSIGQGVVPYADIEAVGDENKLETLDIYVFGKDSVATSPTYEKMLLERIYRSGTGSGGAIEGEESYLLGDITNGKEATISVDPGKNKVFYFVANSRIHSSLYDVKLHVTDTAEFKMVMTNQQKDSLICPLPMSAVKEINMATWDGANVPVELIRRVARFDIQNRSDFTDFIIEKVVLEKYPTDTYIFPSKDYPSVNRATRSLIIPFDQAVADADTKGLVNSVFYMYPSDKTSDIVLRLQGKQLNNSAQIVTVPLKNYSTNAYIKISPNNRYLVDVMQKGNGILDATLRVVDWITGDTVNVNTGYGSIVLSADTLSNGNKLEVGAEVMADPITINVAAETEWKIVNNASWLDVTADAIQANETMSKSFKVQTTEANPTVSVREAVVFIQNVARPSLRQPLRVLQAAGKVQFGAITAPAAIDQTGTDGTPVVVAVTCNDGTNWTVSDDSAGWLTITKEGKNIKIEAAQNESGTERTATVTVSSTTDATVKATFTVTQNTL